MCVSNMGCVPFKLAFPSIIIQDSRKKSSPLFNTDADGKLLVAEEGMAVPGESHIEEEQGMEVEGEELMVREYKSSWNRCNICDVFFSGLEACLNKEA